MYKLFLKSNGTRLPPKAVFGVAATEALGFELRPHHFRRGLDTVCFRAIHNAGYPIAPKYQEIWPDMPLLESEERIWAEGVRGLLSIIVSNVDQACHMLRNEPSRENTGGYFAKNASWNHEVKNFHLVLEDYNGRLVIDKKLIVGAVKSTKTNVKLQWP